MSVNEAECVCVSVCAFVYSVFMLPASLAVHWYV